MSDGVRLPMASPDPGLPADPVFPRIAIVGLGFLGGSLGLAVHHAWPRALVIGVDRNDVLETAVRRHVVDVAADDLVVVAEASLVVLAAPVRASMHVLTQLSDVIPGEAVITDLCATKRRIVEAARELPPRLTFVGGHPLAGGPRGGIANARADLFAGRPWVFTPCDDQPELLARLFRLAEGVGAKPVLQTPGEHDRLLAYLQQLPLLVATALMEIVGEAAGERGLGLAGRGLADMTRLAASPSGPWPDVFETNLDETGRALDALIELLTFLRGHLDSAETIERAFESANAWREQIPARDTRLGP